MPRSIPGTALAVAAAARARELGALPPGARLYPTEYGYETVPDPRGGLFRRAG